MKWCCDYQSFTLLVHLKFKKPKLNSDFVLGSSEDQPQNQESDEPIAKTLKKKYPKILDGKYFNLISDIDESLSVQCMTCNVIVHGSAKSTGNIHSHYNGYGG